MKLIADSGSTKVEWCLLDHDKPVRQIFTSGFNASIMSTNHKNAKNYTLHFTFPDIF